MNEKQKNNKLVFVALAVCGFATAIALSGCGGSGGGSIFNDPNNPNGYVLADIETGGRDQIAKIDLRTGNVTFLTNFTEGGAELPTTAGHGQPIYFYRNTSSSGTTGLSKMNPDGSGFTYIGPMLSSFGMNISANGQKLAYYSLNDQIFTINADGTNDQVVFQSSEFTGGGDISSDASKVVFSSAEDGELDIWTVGSDGSNPVNLTPDTTGIWMYNPTFSPDGTKIAYDAWDAGTSQSCIWIMNADGTNRVKLTGADNLFCESFSPDGKWVLYTDGSLANDQIVMVRTDGSGFKKVVYTETSDELGWVGTLIIR